MTVAIRSAVTDAVDSFNVTVLNILTMWFSNSSVTESTNLDKPVMMACHLSFVLDLHMVLRQLLSYCNRWKKF